MLNRFKFSFFSSTPSIQNCKRVGKDITTATGLSVLAYQNYKVCEWQAKRYATLFEARLSPEQKAEFERSPEKLNQYIDQCKDEIRIDMWPN